MSTTILIPTALRPYAENSESVAVEGKNVGELAVGFNQILRRGRLPPRMLRLLTG